MNRVRAEALALVNWKSVFYERYLLDRHVTALEGDNGAGKTTVMIAAYVVLLPDMSRLRFTNLGETGATGGDKGIWGRLGEVGRPSYAAMEFRLPRGERVLAGVHLERKGEPTVEPTPFLVTGLRDDVRLQDLLLLVRGDVELVPELSELRDNAARLGARLQVFSSAKDYFGALFDQGIMPMRLGTDEERGKLNELLKTSMTGGMSRGLLEELRSFLLKEETGLADTLQRMRANLDACRRTRTEVVEAQQLEREIGAVYEAGEEMFAAAVAATRQRAEEMGRRVAEKELARREAEDAEAEAQEALRVTRAQIEGVEQERVAAAQEVEASKAWEGRVRSAVQWARELEARERALRVSTEWLEAAERSRYDAGEQLRRANEGVAAASDTRERAAVGLADLQKGLEELHRRADAHRRVVERLARARELLEAPLLDATTADAMAVTVQESLTALDAERLELTRRIEDATAHRRDHASAMQALTAILERSVEPVEALETARDALTAVRSWKDAAQRRTSLATQLRAAEVDHARQVQAAERARQLGVTWGEGGGRVALGEALDHAERALAEGEAQVQAAAGERADAERRLNASLADIRALEARAAAWRELEGRALHLGEALGSVVSDRASLDEARRTLSERHLTQRSEGKRLAEMRDARLAEARQLRQSGGAFPAALLALRDDLTADLLAAHFDDLGLEEAAEMEARLGPLAHALVVSDVDAAARAVGKRSEDLPTVWLVGEQDSLSLDPDGHAGSRSARDVLVREREALRVSRVPDRPTLGRAAREHRAAAIEKEAQGLGEAIERVQSEERRTAQLLKEADTLLAGVATWVLGDPSDALESARRLAGDADRARREAAERVAEVEERVRHLKPRVRALRNLLPDAGLLDAPDLQATVEQLRLDLGAAERAAAILARIGGAPATLEGRLDALRQPPWSEEQVAAAAVSRDTLNRRRDAQQEALEAVRFVVANASHLAWTDAEDQLKASRGLVPALNAQLESAKAALKVAQAEAEHAQEAVNRAQAEYNQADAERATASERRAEAAQRVAEIGVERPTAALLDEAQVRTATAEGALAESQSRWGLLQQELGRRQARADAAATGVESARVAEEDERKQARPAVEAWERLGPQVEEAGLLAGALSERFRRAFGDQGSVNVWQSARDNRARLIERLRSARGGSAVLDEVERWLQANDMITGEGYLRAWILVRDWLRARLPAQIAEGDEPLEALQRFRDHLQGLAERLDRQERDLRGASEDVARGIDVQVRKAQGRVRRLNEHLDGVHFGNIRGIQVRMLRVERMEQVLRALRTGEANEMLFQKSLPVEEALEEIFRRFGGGRMGGQRLLDYREYLHLQVDVRRGAGTEWEAANPAKLSTGEAIGVGAALMMVVLTEWERDANLLRGRRSFGSMRFLFLDEANRLDPTSLGTLFDLCRNLDLQLLVAAPEVERAQGATVFRLVRGVGEDGVEQVLVSGRRVIGEA